jgi:hypothetical protein
VVCWVFSPSSRSKPDGERVGSFCVGNTLHLTRTAGLSRIRSAQYVNGNIRHLGVMPDAESAGISQLAISVGKRLNGSRVSHMSSR